MCSWLTWPPLKSWSVQCYQPWWWNIVEFSCHLMLLPRSHSSLAAGYLPSDEFTQHIGSCPSALLPIMTCFFFSSDTNQVCSIVNLSLLIYQPGFETDIGGRKPRQRSSFGKFLLIGQSYFVPSFDNIRSKRKHQLFSCNICCFSDERWWWCGQRIW